VLVVLGLMALAAKGLPEEKEGERFVRSLNASDQLKPSPAAVSAPSIGDKVGNLRQSSEKVRPRLLPAVLAVLDEPRPWL
jgi:hypothetical protein